VLICFGTRDAQAEAEDASMADRVERAKRWSIGGAVLAALAASSCCLGPLLLAALGIGGAGATAALGAYRPYLLLGTAALLGAGFTFTYRKPRVVGGDACGCERPRANRAGRIGLWLATVVVAVVAAAPPLLAKWPDPTRARRGAISDANFAKATIAVEGIDCEACAAPMRKALAKVGGLHDLRLDIPQQSITVTYEPAPGRLESYVAAINGLGYEAKLPNGSEVRR
jgi:mercuric ion transport protein